MIFKMESLKNKREKLYNLFRTNATKNGLDFDSKYPTYNSWENENFKNESSVLSLFEKSIKQKLIAANSTEKNFFQTFACDLNWAKTTKYCGAVPQKQEPVKAPEPVRKQVNVSDLDPQYQPNVQYIIPNKNTSNVQPNQPNKAPDKVTFKRITNPNDD